MPLRTLQRVSRQNAKPVYWQVKEMLKASIERGDLKPGEVLPGRLELCRLLGTNRPAVDRAIAELVKEGWLISIKGKGTFVAEPEAQRTWGTLTFAVVWAHPTPQRGGAFTTKDNIYWGPLLRGISYAAGDLEVRLLFRHCPPDTFRDLFREARVDGLIVLAPHVDDETVLNELRRDRLPFVATSSAYEDDSLPCVDTDNFEGVRQVLEHLWGLGHKQIAIVNLALQSTDLLRRWEAFQELMGKAGIALDPRWTVLSTTYRWGEVDRWIEGVEEWLCSVPLPTAIVAAAYDMALIVLKALQRQGIAVPQQVSLVGFDDPASAAFLEPPLTTVRQPLEAIGRRAVQKLYEALREGVIPEGTELMPPELVVRSSTAPPRGDS
ncbi:Arabinose metabolism transcriptional repressor [bacterium HR17]|uniref:Arabinose metabolism transcriptional repressor n=1 Tax=Candidatus Fervidibacter japonicus TaxID=2035412 RepID=A0A2H5X9Z5_9BACT|nr:Arabinose metabolism transcriptional repressor [bacterium HR17]